MITIKLCGGLGNQLFQLALGLTFEGRGRQVRYDLSAFESDPARRYLLDDFGFDLPKTSAENPTIIEPSLLYHENILVLRNAVLQGYWQNEKYFEHLGPYIRGMLFERVHLGDKTKELALKIAALGTSSCFVHIRRSDNLRPTSTLYHGLTEPNDPYYGRAIAIVKEKVETPHFFVFSDDPAYVEQTVQPGLISLTKVSHNAPSFTERSDHNLDKNSLGREVEDLYLMSLCHHAIIANSTFSWWGSWLNKREGPELRNRIVTAPDPWYSSDQAGPTDIIPARWTKVPVK